jgi:hypothetical protein
LLQLTYSQGTLGKLIIICVANQFQKNHFLLEVAPNYIRKVSDWSFHAEAILKILILNLKKKN